MLNIHYNLKFFRETYTLLSQADFAEVIGKNKGNIQSYEEGRGTPPIELLEQLGNKYDIDLDPFIKKRMTKDNISEFFKSTSVIVSELEKIEANDLQDQQKIIDSIKDIKQHLEGSPELTELCDELLKTFYSKESTISIQRKKIINFYERQEKVREIVKKHTGKSS